MVKSSPVDVVVVHNVRKSFGDRLLIILGAVVRLGLGKVDID